MPSTGRWRRTTLRRQARDLERRIAALPPDDLSPALVKARSELRLTLGQLLTEEREQHEHTELNDLRTTVLELRRLLSHDHELRLGDAPAPVRNLAPGQIDGPERAA